MPDYRDTSNVTSTVYYNELATLLLNTGGLLRVHQLLQDLGISTLWAYLC
jgi:hypothetical protein